MQSKTDELCLSRLTDIIALSSLLEDWKLSTNLLRGQATSESLSRGLLGAFWYGLCLNRLNMIGLNFHF